MAKLIKLSGDKPIEIRRDEHGVRHVAAQTDRDLYFALGYCHAMDRGLQMLLMRVLGRGQACELLDDTDEMLAVDVFFRRMNWAGHLKRQLKALPVEVRGCCEAYTEGVNARLQRKRPWEFKMVGYKPTPWTLDDSLMMSRLVGYLTLAQSQWEVERFIVQLVQAGADPAALEELWPGQLGELDVELLQQVTLEERIVPETLRWNSPIPRMMASNNWVISGSRTASGKPILANDPHLEVNRLPNIWYEILLTMGDKWAFSATMPGLPGLLLARTRDLAWGATYTFMDTVDSWVEHCREGQFRRGDKWKPFDQRKETIRRKKHPPHEVVFWENQHGVLEGDPRKEGHYLSTLWSASQSGAESLISANQMWNARTVEEGMDHLGRIETSWSWVLADTSGNIGFQMSGLMPKRREGATGLVPLPGWDEANDWQDFVDHKDLPRCLNPEAGYFVTANQDLNEHGIAKPINAPMAPHRANRIRALLAKLDQATFEDNIPIQYDVYSLQAEAFMELLTPLLPDTPQAEILKAWDLTYTPESQGAYLFEAVYRSLVSGVFGPSGLGEQVVDYLWDETGILTDFADNFDRVLLSPESRWFGGQDRDTLYRDLVARGLDTPPKPWGERNRITLTHIFFGGKMPRFLRFDRGPVALRGGRATPHQGQLYRSAGRQTSFAPSFRMITDMATDEIHTNLAGGPTDRRFSKYYCSDLQNWLDGKYKVLKP